MNEIGSKNAKGREASTATGSPLAAKVVVAYVRQLIESGDFRAGDKLPPERELAQLIGVSRATVRAGLQSLATVGVVDSRRGAGTFVADGPPLLDVNPLSLFTVLHGIPQAELFEARRVIEIDLAGLGSGTRPWRRAGGDLRRSDGDVRFNR